MVTECCDTHAAARQNVDTCVLEPRGRVGPEPESDDHCISRQDFFRAGHCLRPPAPVCTRLAEPGLDDLDAGYSITAYNLQWLAIKEEIDALFLAVADLAA